MIIIEHPSSFLDKTLTEAIRAGAPEAEQEGKLHDDQIDIIQRQRWFRMFVPQEYGGLGLSLPDILKMEECLSWADGSTAWVVTLCSGAGWFIGFLDPDLANEVFRDERVCLAGSGAVGGVARVTPGGYEINGYWKYASGSLYATAFTVNCHIEKDGRPLCHPDGSPVVQSFLLRKDEVKLNKNWNGMGMVATGSHSFEIRDLPVLPARSFSIDPARATLPHPVYQFPFLQLAETTLAVNSSGMAIRFIDLCQTLFEQKAKQNTKELHHARRKMNELRQVFFAAASAAWETLIINRRIPDLLLAEISEVSRLLAHTSRHLVTELYPMCGLEAANRLTEINRVWRNIHTAGQHALFRAKPS
jgi:alkylation response protein AidB-like acyl-CoA dehydrogenase